MTTFAETFNILSAGGTVLLQILLAGILILLALKKRSAGEWLSGHALLIGFLLSLGGALGSLVYSNIIGFTPCILCWWQRIFLYPQVILFGLAAWKNDRRIFGYTLALSIIGIVISIYNNYLQFGGAPLIPCSAAAETASCATRFVFEFGYVTIPLMSFTLFAWLISISVIGKRYEKKS